MLPILALRLSFDRACGLALLRYPSLSFNLTEADAFCTGVEVGGFGVHSSGKRVSVSLPPLLRFRAYLGGVTYISVGISANRN